MYHFTMQLLKYHALGNDYLILDARMSLKNPSKNLIKALCDRHFGIGADGLLFGPLEASGADFGLEIYNPDGSMAEKSGNGLRIFARYLWDQGLLGKDSITIQTMGTISRAQVLEAGKKVRLELGKASFLSKDIPVLLEAKESLRQYLYYDGVQILFYAVSVGNPHCIVPVENISKEHILSIGPFLENHSLFPQKTNVQLLQVLDKHTIALEIWERGAGYTLASGTSASACAALSVKLGWCESPVTVCMPGGVLLVEVSSDFCITMTGPASPIAKVEWLGETFNTL